MFFFHASARACLELKFCGPGLCVNFFSFLARFDSIDFDFNLSKKKSVFKITRKNNQNVREKEQLEDEDVFLKIGPSERVAEKRVVVVVVVVSSGALKMVAKRVGFALTLCAVILSSFGAKPASANFPVVRFKNSTVGIVTEKSGDVLIRGNLVSMNGDLVLSENGNVINVTEAMINLRAKEKDMVARVSKIRESGRLRNFGCNPLNTEYIEKNTTSGEYGECVCKEGYAGVECESIA